MFKVGDIVHIENAYGNKYKMLEIFDDDTCIIESFGTDNPFIYYNVSTGNFILSNDNIKVGHLVTDNKAIKNDIFIVTDVNGDVCNIKKYNSSEREYTNVMVSDLTIIGELY